MTTAWTRTVCRLLIGLSLLTSYPGQAALIGTGEAVQLSAERAAVARELQALGIEPAIARDRVAALSDDEVRSLAGRIDALPAGADVAGILLLVCIVALIWWAWPR